MMELEIKWSYEERKGNIFEDLERDIYLVHCISNDFALGAGIAKQIEIRYNIKQYLKDNFYQKEFIPRCILTKNIFNLVTKEFYWYKPTYKTLTSALIDLEFQVQELQIKELHMPKIGCGLDRLEWTKVKAIIEEIFQEDEIKIVVYSL